MVPTVERPIVATQGYMRINEVPYEEVKQFSSKASKERVSISNTNNTIWFQIYLLDELVGVCALYLAKKKCRIKGDWIYPTHRGKGIGEFLTEARLKIIKSFGYKDVEVLTLHPHYYAKKGFIIHKQVRKGVYLGTKRI